MTHVDVPFPNFAENNLKQCEHGVPLQNICDTCEFGPLPKKEGASVDSLLKQIEALRPVYDAMKIFQGAVLCGTKRQEEVAMRAVWRATEQAARELEDSDD